MSYEAKYKRFIARTGLDEKPFQTECFNWCIMKETKGEKVISEQQEQEQEQKQEQVSEANQVISEASNEIYGGILALEMGLGKTIIMLGLIECNFKRHTLIVMPCALLDQWEKCIQKMFGHNPLVYHGSNKKSKSMTVFDILTYPIVLTTYGQLAYTENNECSSLLHDIIWDRVICDEGHNVSHHKTKVYAGIMKVRSKIHWLVTGTPIQNREKELHNLYNILGLKKEYYKKKSNYKEIINKFVFYRTKAGVGLVISPMNIYTDIIEWSNETELNIARRIHSKVLKFNVRLDKAEEEKEKEAEARTCEAEARTCEVEAQAQTGAGAEAVAGEDKAMLLLYMLKAKKFCIYPPMLEYKKNETNKLQAVASKILSRQDNGCGKIVFCHYYAEIDALATLLQEANPLLSITKFDGRIPISKRHAILNDPVNVLIAQIKMCREGLNLQENYSEIYFPSPHFNPAVEAQAIARCWRIGQKKEVNVFKFAMKEPVKEMNENITAYSMDSYTFLLQNKKRKIIEKMEESATA